MSLRSNAHDVEINSHARHTQSTHKKQLETRKTRRTTTAMKFSLFFRCKFFFSPLDSRFDAIYFLKAVRTWWIIRCNEFLFNGTTTAAAILLLTNTMIKLSGSAPVGVSSRPSAFSRTEPDLTIFFPTLKYLRHFFNVFFSPHHTPDASTAGFLVRNA